jgi:hypothetical protein
VKISSTRTGATICKFGEEGSGEEQFDGPWGVAVTSDSSFVITADFGHHRIKVLQLMMAADSSSAQLEFVRHIGMAEEAARGSSTALVVWHCCQAKEEEGMRPYSWLTHTTTECLS